MNKPADPISIDGKDYQFDALSPRAQVLVQHISSVDQQLDGLDRQMDLLKVARHGCYSLLITQVQDNGEQETDPAGRIPEEPPAS